MKTILLLAMLFLPVISCSWIHGGTDKCESEILTYQKQLNECKLSEATAIEALKKCEESKPK